MLTRLRLSWRLFVGICYTFLLLVLLWFLLDNFSCRFTVHPLCHFFHSSNSILSEESVLQVFLDPVSVSFQFAFYVTFNLFLQSGLSIFVAIVFLLFHSPLFFEHFSSLFLILSIFPCCLNSEPTIFLFYLEVIKRKSILSPTSFSSE